ncbi:actin-related protein 6-like [Varroa jacobsoni]|uniref:Actin-related protein 6 n=1 Tax=Varroa destructor TaxID=109461 RepID=A0A7M7JJJ7_VARDE|nr:actin-related protein 6-like [Varroa destructor]XP_022653145.1 actin-related protein 6-like [Varroa destructor]XP_022653146.1 actin-related protein 6-like [Varroa destructor]XP_022653147.1 actin-related protein 6-like [Varroa destructor]XP_022653148.1 actin-related protein 6-like [Varroa destructor]XP_022653149.1 actin-related protein 6-like [Varroa destructor]XP_022653150.1 actin-related protein 6-like [Varroa destructor]XP_022705146.1 actin-related protein 6-like [Varroa jacobsoni]XP_0
MAAEHMFIMDNGANSLKVGYATDNQPRLIPNAITKAKSETRRRFIGDQVEDCKDMSQLYYILCHERGYLVNWEVQKQVWDYVFSSECLGVDFSSTGLILTEPYFDFCSIQENLTEIFFEDYGVQSLCVINPSSLVAYKYHQENPSALCSLVLDSGYSFSHVVPYVKGRRVKEGIRRINVGGKKLTNYLKDVISFRQLNVMDETYVINQVKEDVCFVSQNYRSDMDIARKCLPDNVIWRDYVLPDYTSIKRGFVRPKEQTNGRATDTEQIVRMNLERFQVPELLFHPSDVGIDQMGICEAMTHAVKSLPKDVHPHMYSNILLTGGNALFPGFRERVASDLRSLVPELYDIHVKLDDPVNAAWHGGKLLANNKDDLAKKTLTKQQYGEQGIAFCVDFYNLLH